MKTAATQKPELLSIRMPTAQDGRDVYALAKGSATLDVNSEYAYLLLGTHFQKSCAIATVNGKPAGFVSAYILPEQPDVLFVWQVAVADKYQKRGLALAMLKDIVQRPCCAQTHYIQTTVSPSNTASRALFTALAHDLDAHFDVQPLFPESCFSEPHEAEPLFIIGPLSH